MPVCLYLCVCCLLARCKSAFGFSNVVWIYRVMLVAGSPAPSPRTVFKDFPLQLRPSNLFQQWGVWRARAGQAQPPHRSAVLEAGGCECPGGCFS